MQKSFCDVGSCTFCSNCLPEWKDLIALRKQTLVFKKGEALFSEGDEVQGIYFMLSGAVKVHKKWGQQKELIIRFAGHNDIIGLRGWTGNAQFPISATALAVTKVCFIPLDFLEASLSINPELSNHLLRFYSEELQKAEQRMSDLAHLPVKGRLVRAMFALQEAFGLAEDGFLNVDISRQDIASYAGTTYETVFKIFSEWIGLHYLQSEGKRVKLLDASVLAGQLNN